MKHFADVSSQNSKPLLDFGSLASLRSFVPSTSASNYFRVANNGPLWPLIWKRGVCTTLHSSGFWKTTKEQRVVVQQLQQPWQKMTYLTSHCITEVSSQAMKRVKCSSGLFLVSSRSLPLRLRPRLHKPASTWHVCCNVFFSLTSFSLLGFGVEYVHFFKAKELYIYKSEVHYYYYSRAFLV